MAQTREEIANEMQVERSANSVLSSMTSTSATAILTNLINLFAFGGSQMQKMWDIFLAKVEAILAQRGYGSILWWPDFMLFYRFNQIPARVNNVITYPDETLLPTISRCSARNVTDVFGKYVLLKLAKGSAPNWIALDNDELQGAKAYADLCGPAGVRVIMNSLAGDELGFTATVYYNPLLDLADFQQRLLAAVKSYIASLAPDNRSEGIFHRSMLYDAMLYVEGFRPRSFIQDITVLSPLASAPLSIDQTYETDSGYMIESTTAPWLGSITWIADEL